MRQLDDKSAIKILAIVPRGNSGLHVIGKLSLKMAVIPISPMPSLIIWVFLVGSLLWHATFAAVSISALALISFVYPIMTIVEITKKRKMEKLAELNRELKRLGHILSDRLSEANGTFDDECVKIADRIDMVAHLQEMTEQMSTWPINIRIFTQLIIIILIPWSLIVIEHIVF